MSAARKAYYSKIEIIGKAVLQFSKDGVFINEFISLSKAAEIVAGKKKYASNIMDCCKGKKKTAYGFVWKYKYTI